MIGPGARHKMRVREKAVIGVRNGGFGTPGCRLSILKSEPDGMAAAVEIPDDMGFDTESIRIQQAAVFLGIQAGVVERFTTVRPDRLALCRPAGEEQRSSGLRVRGETRKHVTLLVHAQMEKAVPGDDAIEAPANIQFAHVRHDPFGIRKPGPAEPDQ
jgi:hypothetical protein